MKYKVILTPTADRELLAIYRTIREHAPLAASGWIIGVRKAIETLTQFPKRTHSLQRQGHSIGRFMSCFTAEAIEAANAFFMS